MLTREVAWAKLNEWVHNPNLVKHCLAVEAAMLRYARRFGVDQLEENEWSIAGLVHDADWEQFPKEHPNKIVEWLSVQQASPAIINAVEAHGFEFGIEPNTQMAKVLCSVDELTGLIVAVTLVRPSRKLVDVSVDAVFKKWKTASFAQGVKRADIERGAAEIGVPLPEHVAVVLTAMQEISNDLGL